MLGTPIEFYLNDSTLDFSIRNMPILEFIEDWGINMTIIDLDQPEEFSTEPELQFEMYAPYMDIALEMRCKISSEITHPLYDMKDAHYKSWRNMIEFFTGPYINYSHGISHNDTLFS